MGRNNLPLEGTNVLEFTHTIMGPYAGMVLADLGCNVIKVEPAPHGDRTRRLHGFAAGFFGSFNRNKQSIAIDLKHDEGRDIALSLAKDADVIIENFAPGTMDRLGLGEDALREINPKVIYCSLKGFLSGPYEDRLALDEVVQHMSGLAFMTGLPGKPMRTGASVVDILGGVFGVVGILAALIERRETGVGASVKSALFETACSLMAQHMAGEVLTGARAQPMGDKRGAWAIYEAFPTRDERMVFLAITSDQHWKRFVEITGYADWIDNPSLRTNEQVVLAREAVKPRVQEFIASHTLEEISAILEEARLPFAPTSTPHDLFDNPHLNADGRMLNTRLAEGVYAALPRLPIEISGQDFSLRLPPPHIGEHTAQILSTLGYTPTDIERLQSSSTVA